MKTVVNLLKMITIPEEIVKKAANGLKEVHRLQGKDMETNKKSLRLTK